MKPDQVFLLCAGEHKRWVCVQHPCKQLAPIAGVPLLERTARQLETRGLVPIIVDRDWLIHGLPHLYPLDCSVLSETIASTKRGWKGRTLFVLGDVVFSEESLDRVISDARSLQFFGSKELGELYACVINESIWSLFYEILVSVGRAKGNGMLWEVYRACCGFALDDHKFNRFLFTDIHDEWTRDLDYVDHWLDWSKRWEAKPFMS